MLLAFVAALTAGPLDAPIVPTQPTVRSEIQRGRDAAHGCDAIDIVTETSAYHDCIAQVENQNRQGMPTGYEAFDIGLYRVARDHLSSLVKVLTQNPTSVIDMSLVKAVFDVEEGSYDRARSALNLTEQDVDGALY